MTTLAHTAAATQNLITFGWEQFNHPPYSPDLAPSDFKLFLHLKSFLAGRRLYDDEVKVAVTTCFASQAASFYDEGIQNWYPALTSALTMVETTRCNPKVMEYIFCRSPTGRRLF
jgi:hypothetical protein